jgi:hypothetical protein
MEEIFPRQEIVVGQRESRCIYGGGRAGKKDLY